MSRTANYILLQISTTSLVLMKVVQANDYPANTRRSPALGQRWASVLDGGPALAQHRENVSCLLGIDY